MLHYSKTLCLVAVTALLIAGCGESTETPPPDDGTGGSAGADGGTGGSGGVAGAGGEGGFGGSIDLCANVDCDDDSECTIDGICDPSSGICEGGSDEAVDAACDQDGGRFCDGEGNCVDCNTEGQCSQDGNDCTLAACEGNACVQLAKAVDQPCSEGGSFCDGAGNCVECTSSLQCSNDSNECTSPVCNDGTCEMVEVSGSCDFMGTAGVCSNGVCVDADRCDPYPCQDLGPCVADQCNPSTGQCSYPNEPDGRVCQLNGYSGECASGQCDLCAGVTCSDTNQCTIDATCSPSTGMCGAPTNRPVNYPCSQSGGSVCDGQGQCVRCNTASQCNDGNDCTADACSGAHQCTHTPVANGSICTGLSNICIDGACQPNTLGQLVFSGDRNDLYWAGNYAGIYNVWSGFQPWGLAGFYLNFTGSGVDREVERMTANWVGTSTTTVLYVRLEDDEGDDGMTWRIDSQQLPYGSERYYYEGCNTGTGETKTLRALPSDKVPVLLGFDLDRSGEDKVEKVYVRLYPGASGNTVVLGHGLYDATAVSSPGPYCARVDYALIPKNRVLGQPHYADPSTRKRTYVKALAGANRPILQGFRLEFTNGDHNVDQVGVRMEPGQVTVWLNDDNDDDPFEWEIWWANLQ
jgi:hypothetical protein